MNGYERMIAEQREEIERLRQDFLRYRKALCVVLARISGTIAADWPARVSAYPNTLESYLLDVLSEDLLASPGDPDPTGTDPKLIAEFSDEKGTSRVYMRAVVPPETD